MSNTPKDGGPAFPVASCADSNGQVCWGTDGMTLRAYFAAQALMGLLADSDNLSSPERNAEAAVASADALLAELAKGPTK